jgi:hypothetical protein
MTTPATPRPRYRSETEIERLARIEQARAQGLSKMCSCTIHEGPCWAHKNKLEKAMNQEWFQEKILTARCDLALGCAGFSIKERQRIADLRHALEMHYIEVIPEALRAPAHVFALSERQLMHPSIQRWIELTLFAAQPLEGHPGAYLLIET